MAKKKHSVSEKVSAEIVGSALPNDGFFTDSIASANESTGYAVLVPETEEEAKAVSELGHNPNTRSKKKKK